MNKSTQFFFATFLSIFFFGSFAQNSTLKSYDLGGDDYANVLVRTANGSFITVGSTNANGAGGYDAFLENINSDGTVIWQKQYGGTGTEFGTNVTITSDGNYLLIGRSNSYTSNNNFDFFAVKADTSGNVVWTKTFGTDSNDYGFKVVESNDGGYFFLGQTKGSIGAKNNGRLEMLAVKTNAMGDVLWSKSIGSVNGNEVGYDAVALGNDGYVIAGYSGINLIGLNDVLIQKLSVTGQLEMSILFGGSSDDDARKILPVDNGLLIAGNTRSYGVVGQGDVFVAKLSVNSGTPTISWMKVLGAAAEESLTSFEMAENGKFLLTGHSTSFGQSGASFIAEVDTNGIISWVKGFDGNGDDFIMDVNNNNSKIRTIGYSASFGTAPNNIILSETDDNFNLGCNLINTNLKDSFYTPQQMGPFIADFTSDSLNANSNSVTAQIHSNTVTANTVCVVNGIHDIDAFSNIAVYPNPANNIIAIEFSKYIENETLIITDITGKKVKEIFHSGLKNEINVADLENGVYFVNCLNNKLSVKVIVLK